MAARAGMVYLVNLVRDLIGDPWAADMQFSDDDVQNALDRTRVEERYLATSQRETIYPGGSVAYLDYYASAWWEGTPVFVNAAYGTVAPSTVDSQRGHWQFSTQPTCPVSVTGSRYDPYEAAADLCDQWATALAGDVDYKDPNYSFTLSQRQANLSAAARKYRAMTSPSVGRMVRADAT